MDVLELSIIFSDRAVHLSLLLVYTYSIYHCNCNTTTGRRLSLNCMHAHLEKCRAPPPLRLFLGAAHSTSSKKGLGPFLSVSLNRQTFQLQRRCSGWTGQMAKQKMKPIEHTNELDLADWKREHPHGKLIICQSAKWESLLANWDISAYRLLCAWKLSRTADPNRTAQIRIHLKQRDCVMKSWK